MTLGLNLASSEAKLAHARQHMKLLESEVPADPAERGPYAIRFSQVDPQTGWCDVLMVPNEIEKPRLRSILGDVIHNLRCALDYIVTVLVDASGATLTTRHQFPIFLTEDGYLSRVVNHKSGPLQGIAEGLTVFRDLQPYKHKPDPRQDPLWHIHRFNNADKHREPAALLAIPSGAIQLRFNGIPAERVPVLEITEWDPNKEHVIHSIRSDPPSAYNLRAEGPIKLAVSFTTPAFESEPAHSVNLVQLRKSCDHVAMVIDAFKLL
jgi:hypothetical protein